MCANVHLAFCSALMPCCCTLPFTPQSLPPLQVSLQDARSRAQIELPEATTQALLRLHGRHAPDKLPLVEGVLRKMAGGAAGTAGGAGAAEGDGGQQE